MATQVGKAYIRFLSGGAIKNTVATIAPNMNSLRLAHNVEMDRIKSQGGDTHGLIGSDSHVECQFEMVPEGADSADALTSAGIPDAPATFTVEGLPVVAFGPFADVFNVSADAVWVYEGGANINGSSDGKWTASVTLKRYPLITDGAVIA